MDAFRKLRWFSDTYRKEYLIATISLVLAFFFQMVPPWILGNTADLISQGQMDLRSLYIRVGLLVVAIMISYLVGYFYRYYFFLSSDLIGRNGRRNIVSKLLTRSNVYFEGNSTGSIMGKATNDVNALKELGGFGHMMFLESIVFPILLIGFMAYTVDLRLTIVSSFPLIAIVFLSNFIRSRLYRSFHSIQQAFDRLNQKVIESISGIRVTRAFNREKSELSRFKEGADDYYDASMEQVKYMALFPFSSRLFVGICYVIAFIYGGRLIGQGEITIGSLISFVIYLNMLAGPMFSLGEFVSVSEQASASSDRIKELLTYEEQMVDREDAKVAKDKIDIRFENFSFTYPQGKRPTLNNIDIDLAYGSTLGVVGKIGSGKTTLLKQFLRLYPIEDGQIYLAGDDINDLTMESVRDKTGYVPQIHILFSKTIRENILFGKDASDEELLQAIEDADFIKDIEDFPLGLDTMVGEKGVSLSGGQRQRLSIARALIKNPEILILDDSLSAVDAKTEENILASIKRRRKNKTNIIAAHRLSGIIHADEIIVLDEGRIVERGSHRELLENKGWYKEQFEKQQLERSSLDG